ncbi:cupin domain-containing protein [Lacrimispora sp.]|uniref:cupin domain-containing protein n=1 Tax=Lacrimispora sp. TaxID=2719234 RepID=UPI002FDAA334
MFNYNSASPSNLDNTCFRSQPLAPTDYGPNPFTIDISKAVINNNAFRTALWTGAHLQLTLMSIQVGDEIGLEMHPDDDQFLYIESGHGVVLMGTQEDYLYFQQPIFTNSAVFIPAGIWHNVINTGEIPLKLFSIYAPPHHPWGTIHQTKAVAEADANHY